MTKPTPPEPKLPTLPILNAATSIAEPSVGNFDAERAAQLDEPITG